nr:hypothetical protein [Tanacetum cinerariifolium]
MGLGDTLETAYHRYGRNPLILIHCLQSFHLQKELHLLLQTAGLYKKILRSGEEEKVGFVPRISVSFTRPRFSNDYHFDGVQTGQIQNTCTRPPVLKGKASDVHRIASASAKHTAHPNVDPVVF